MYKSNLTLFCCISVLSFTLFWHAQIFAVPTNCDNECRERVYYLVPDGQGGYHLLGLIYPDCRRCVTNLGNCKNTQYDQIFSTCKQRDLSQIINVYTSGGEICPFPANGEYTEGEYDMKNPPTKIATIVNTGWFVCESE